MTLRLIRFGPPAIVALLAAAMAAADWVVSEKEGLAGLQRLELASYDWRLRRASLDPTVGADTGIVFIDDEDQQQLRRTIRVHWPVPRWIHAVVLDELAAQGATTVAYDVFFIRRRDDGSATAGRHAGLDSDEAFARSIQEFGSVILGASVGTVAGSEGLEPPDPLFRDAAHAVGHAAGLADRGGALRRVKPFMDDPVHGRIWQLGFAAAARTLGWQLDKATLTPDELTIPDRHGSIQRVPLDGAGHFLIPWRLRPTIPGSAHVRRFTSLLKDSSDRQQRNPTTKPMGPRTVIIGSAGSSPALADAGSTPLADRTHYCTAHWNIADSLLRGDFIRPASRPLRLGMSLGLLLAAAAASWKLRTPWATTAVAALGLAYLWLALALLEKKGLWVPVALPLIGAIATTHGILTFFRLAIEYTHRQQARSIFSKVVSPSLLDLILEQPKLSWKPEHRILTVFFSDIRGFTALTDDSRLECIGLNPTEPTPTPGRLHALRDQLALETVNLYLTTVVDTIKEHGATLDKYMGDCVMAFWGAPINTPDHAAKAVRAAIAVQSRLLDLNNQRTAENQRRTASNRERVAKGLPCEPLLPLLTLGTGINTGPMTAGFMGSPSHLSNYTVFGREVNVAARLESLSGSSRILITEHTLAEIQKSDPALATLAIPIGPHSVKGISQPIDVFSINWQEK